MADAIRSQGRRAWAAAGFESFDDYLRSELGELANDLIAAGRRARFTPPPPPGPGLAGRLEAEETAAPEPDGPLRLIDLCDVPCRWPTIDGMVSPAPDAWRYQHDADRLAVVDAFYRDLLWNVQLELDGVDWPGRGHRDRVSVLAACRDVARLWHLPSSEEVLPATTARSAAVVPGMARSWRDA